MLNEYNIVEKMTNAILEPKIQNQREKQTCEMEGTISKLIQECPNRPLDEVCFEKCVLYGWCETYD